MLADRLLVSIKRCLLFSCDKKTSYTVEQNDFEGFLFKVLKTTEHFKIPPNSLRIFQ